MRRIAAWIFFALYVAALFYFLLISERLGRPYSERAPGCNLVPFREIARFLKYREALGRRAVIMNIAGNVVGFIPFGMLLPLLVKKCRSLWKTGLCSIALSLLAESLQLAFRVGSFDVDDLLLNAIGGVLGYLAFRAIALLRERRGGQLGKAQEGV